MKKPNLREIVKLAAFKLIYPLTYRLFCLRPQKKNDVLFCEVRHGFLTDTYKPIVRELKKRGVKALKVVYSKEEPRRLAGYETGEVPEGSSRRSVPGSLAFVPSVAGLIIAGEVVKDMTNC